MRSTATFVAQCPTNSDTAERAAKDPSLSSVSNGVIWVPKLVEDPHGIMVKQPPNSVGCMDG